MTQDYIVEMAKQAGFVKEQNGVRVTLKKDTDMMSNLEHFAKLVATNEREACAKYVEECSLPDAYSEACLPEIADEIRARGQK